MANPEYCTLLTINITLLIHISWVVAPFILPLAPSTRTHSCFLVKNISHNLEDVASPHFWPEFWNWPRFCPTLDPNILLHKSTDPSLGTAIVGLETKWLVTNQPGTEPVHGIFPVIPVAWVGAGDCSAGCYLLSLVTRVWKKYKNLG